MTKILINLTKETCDIMRAYFDAFFHRKPMVSIRSNLGLICSNFYFTDKFDSKKFLCFLYINSDYYFSNSLTCNISSCFEYYDRI